MLKFFPFPFLLGIIILMITIAIYVRRKRDPIQSISLFIFCIYVLLVIGVTLFPIPIPNIIDGTISRQPASFILSRVNLIPFNYSQFSNLDPAFIFFREIVENILLTLPFGFGFSFIFHVNAKNVPLLAVVVGLGIETMQLLMCFLVGLAYRGIDINDAITNAIGVLLGYAFFRIFAWIFVALARHFKLEPKGVWNYVYTITSQAEDTVRLTPGHKKV